MAICSRPRNAPSSTPRARVLPKHCPATTATPLRLRPRRWRPHRRLSPSVAWIAASARPSRGCHWTAWPQRWIAPKDAGKELMPKMVFIEKDGTRREVDAPLGLSVLEIAHRNKIDLEGACEGSLACSTCHVIVDSQWYGKLGEASEDEEDMLDLAFGLTHTSRLGCQIKITEELDGLTVKLPPATRNMMVDK